MLLVVRKYHNDNNAKDNDNNTIEYDNYYRWFEFSKFTL